MKTSEAQRAQQARDQISLPLFKRTASAAIPADKQQELARTLMELLLNAAQEHLPDAADEGGEDDEPPQTHA